MSNPVLDIIESPFAAAFHSQGIRTVIVQHVLNAFLGHFLRVDHDGKVSVFNGVSFIPTGLQAHITEAVENPVPKMESVNPETTTHDVAGSP